MGKRIRWIWVISLAAALAATVGFADSGIGRSSAAVINGVSNSPAQTINLLANLVLPDGSKIASFIFDDLVKYAAANGTPIAGSQMA